MPLVPSVLRTLLGLIFFFSRLKSRLVAQPRARYPDACSAAGFPSALEATAAPGQVAREEIGLITSTVMP